MEPVTVSEFRRSTKVILDAALNDPVYIRRGDDLFEVSYYGDVLEKKVPRISLPLEKKSRLAAPSVTVIRNLNPQTGLPQHRTGAVIMGEIHALENEVQNADFTNQDPDYWEVINAKKTQIDSLWKEWHEVTGQ